jgi:hypothetical protein
VTKADGRQIDGYGSSCRNLDGSWEIISSAETRRDHDFASIANEMEAPVPVPGTG